MPVAIFFFLFSAPIRFRPKVKRTGKGSSHEAPTIEGLTTLSGKSPCSSTRMCSANAFVYVYVFGLGRIKLGVKVSITSSLIHLKCFFPSGYVNRTFESRLNLRTGTVTFVDMLMHFLLLMLRAPLGLLTLGLVDFVGFSTDQKDHAWQPLLCMFFFSLRW